MFDIEISKNELDIIFMALSDCEERIRGQISKLGCSYFELPENLKFIWRDKEAYDKYVEDANHECSKQLDEINELREKLESI